MNRCGDGRRFQYSLPKPPLPSSACSRMLGGRMPAARMYRIDEDPIRQRLLAMFAVSLMAHLSFFSLVQLGNDLHWWDAKPFSMFRKVRLTPEDVAKIQEEQRRQQEQRRENEPTLFVQVTQPSESAPTETAFYSSVSSRAANPVPGQSDQVKIEGRQTQTMRTEDAPRVETGRPTPPAKPELPGTADASPESESQTEVKAEQISTMEVPRLANRVPEPSRQPGLGELALPTPEAPRILDPPKEPKPVEPAPVEPTPVPTPQVAQAPVQEIVPAPAPPRARPRTVTEAKIRQNLLAGERMKQDGGVPRKGEVALDVKGTPFGAYDEALIMAVQRRWFALLDEQRFAGGSVGKVVVKFNLHYDGTVRIVEPKESTVNNALLEALCVRAIRDPAPYEKWPSDMMRMLGSNLREMRFTFFYN